MVHIDRIPSAALSRTASASAAAEVNSQDVVRAIEAFFTKVFVDSTTGEYKQLQEILSINFPKDGMYPYEMVRVTDIPAQCVLEVSRWINKEQSVGGITITLKQYTRGFNEDEQADISKRSLSVEILRGKEIVKTETLSKWIPNYATGQGVQYKYPTYCTLEYTSEELAKPQTEIRLQLIQP